MPPDWLSENIAGSWKILEEYVGAHFCTFSVKIYISTPRTEKSDPNPESSDPKTESSDQKTKVQIQKPKVQIQKPKVQILGMEIQIGTELLVKPL